MIRTIAATALLCAGLSATAPATPSSSAIPPIPLPRPDLAAPVPAVPYAASHSVDNGPDDRGGASANVHAAPAPAKEDPAAYATCIASLTQAGAVFTELPGFDDGDGCGIDRPIKLRQLRTDLKLEPEATIRCETALQLGRWAGGTLRPSARLAFGDMVAITTLHQADSYSCRSRDRVSTAPLSEHAKGNAIDIDAIVLSNGDRVTIQPRIKDGSLTAAFQRAIIASACLYFTTVLGPDSDAAHATHIHLDVIARKSGFRYCW